MCIEKSTTQKCLGWFSLIVAICGIIMITMGVLMYGSDTVKNIALEEEVVDDYRQASFIGLIIFALATIGIAICGLSICCCKIENRCCLMGYGILLLPMWIILIILGAVGMVASTLGKDELTKQCQSVLDQYGTVTTIESEYTEIEISLDIYETLLIDKYMCTVDCPCPPVTAATQATWNVAAVAQATESANNILDDIQSVEDAQNALNNAVADLMADGSTRVIADSFYSVSAGSSIASFETYEACVQSYDENSTTAFGIWAHNLNSQSNFDEIMEWITFFEDEFDCAGVCSPAKFYWSKSVTLGAPTESCVGSIKDELTTAFMGLGGACLVSGFILLCNFILQYCMWFKSSD